MLARLSLHLTPLPLCPPSLPLSVRRGRSALRSWDERIKELCTDVGDLVETVTARHPQLHEQ